MSITQKCLITLSQLGFGYVVDSGCTLMTKEKGMGSSSDILSRCVLQNVCSFPSERGFIPQFLFGERSHGLLVFFIHISVHNSL